MSCSLSDYAVDFIVGPLSNSEDFDFEASLDHLSSLVQETSLVDVRLICFHLLEPILIVVPLSVDQPILPPLNLSQTFDDIIFEP